MHAQTYVVVDLEKLEGADYAVHLPPSNPGSTLAHLLEAIFLYTPIIITDCISCTYLEVGVAVGSLLLRDQLGSVAVVPILLGVAGSPGSRTGRWEATLARGRMESDSLVLSQGNALLGTGTGQWKQSRGM